MWRLQADQFQIPRSFPLDAQHRQDPRNFYREGCIRVCEIGSMMFADVDPETGIETPATRELVRLAMPRRVYTASHLEYIVETAEKIVKIKDQLSGYKITKQSKLLRHFTCDLKPKAMKKLKLLK